MRIYPYLCNRKREAMPPRLEVAHDTDKVQKTMKLRIKLQKNETTLVDEILTAEQIPADVLNMVSKIHSCTLTIDRKD